MNSTEIETTSIEEIIIRQGTYGKQVILNGKEIDLSKLLSFSIDIDCNKIRINSKLFNYPLPIKNKSFPADKWLQPLT